MNVFELSTVASPVIGLVAGICATSGATPFSRASGAATGTLVGLVLTFATRKLVSVMEKMARTERPGQVTWRTSVRSMTVIVPMVTPFATWAISLALVKALFA